MADSLEDAYAQPHERLRVLEWDSDFLGVGIGRLHIAGLTPEEVMAFEDEARRLGIECLYAELDPAEPQPTYEIQRLGYRFVESSTSFVLPKDHPRRSFDVDYHIRRATLDELSLMEEVTMLMAGWSRYAVDPHFGIDVAFRMQMAHLERMARCETDERQLLVTEEDGEVSAFLGMHRNPDPYCDTVATLRKGSGATWALMEAARDWAGDQQLYSGTAASRNLNVFRYVQNCGYRVHGVTYRYHRWFDED